MEDSWRFRAIQGNNICPTCSIYHFPFCPPPPQPSSSMNPSFQKPPYFDPIPNNRPIPRSLDDGYGYIPTAAPVFQRDSFHPISRYDYGGSELRSREFVESDRIVKRMRVVGEMSSDYGSASFSQTRFPTEDERRLSLVREHGVPSIAPPSHIGVDSMSSSYGTQVGNSYGDWQHPRHHLNNSSFYDSMGASVLHQEALVRRNNVYDDKKEIGRVEHDFGYDYDQLKSNTDGDGTLYRSRLQSHYGQNDDSVNYSLLPSYAPASGLTDAPNYVNTSSSHQEGSSALLRGERFQQPHISDYVPYSNQQESRNVYHGNGTHRLQANGFKQADEFLHTHLVNSPLSSGSSVSLYQNKQNFHIHGEQNDVRQSFDFRHAAVDDVRTSVAVHSSSRVEPYSAPKISEQESYLPISTGNGLASTRQVGGLTSQPTSVYPPLPPLPPPAALSVYPPLPPLPPPSLPMEPPGPPPAHLQARALPPNIPLTSSDMGPLLHPSAREGQSFPLKNSSPEKPKIVDACTLFKRPGRDTRPDHIVVILRGLPGSGKSYIAKMLRDLEVENGAKAPRIHSMDDYFMTEVEKVEEREVSKSSGSVKGKKRVTKKVIEYCYEPEMEEAYRSSMLKAFKKTLEDGIFTFIIVDDRNLRIADFAQFWASAKRSGYEVYLLEAMYKDPVGCAARNIHGFASDDIQKMVELWEDAPSLYLRLDIQSLLHGDDLKEHGIQEVDMDMDDVACDDDGQSGLLNRNFLKAMEAPQDDCASDDSVKEEERWDAEEDDPGIKELGRSKWSHDADEDDIERSKRAKGASNALSGLIQAYTKEGKSVHWGDQVGKSGFSIGANKRANVLSLVIGPGAGYNLKSNPLPEDENKGAADTSWQSKKRSVFEEQLRAERASERESFKTVVDRRRQRIVGLEMEDEL